LSRQSSSNKYRKWIGGRGLGLELLKQEDVKPFSESNPVILATSALAGNFPLANRICVNTVTPLTNLKR